MPTHDPEPMHVAALFAVPEIRRGPGAGRLEHDMPIEPDAAEITLASRGEPRTWRTARGAALAAMADPDDVTRRARPRFVPGEPARGPAT